MFHIIQNHDMKEMYAPYGFIVLRHVSSARSNAYWQDSYDCIRRV